MKTKFFAMLACFGIGLVYVNDAKSTDFNVERFQTALTYFNDVVNDCKYARRILNSRAELNDTEEKLRFFCKSFAKLNHHIERALAANNNDWPLVLNMEIFGENTNNRTIMNGMLSAYEHLRQPRYLGEYCITSALGYMAAHRNYSDDMVWRLNNIVVSYENETNGVVTQRLYINGEYLNYLLWLESGEGSE